MVGVTAGAGLNLKSTYTRPLSMIPEHQPSWSNRSLPSGILPAETYNEACLRGDRGVAVHNACPGTVTEQHGREPSTDPLQGICAKPGRFQCLPGPAAGAICDTLPAIFVGIVFLARKIYFDRHAAGTH
jgi:hypothetical protein